MANNTIEILIEAQDKATAALRGLNTTLEKTGRQTEAVSSKSQSMFAGISAAWVQVGAVIAASGWLISAAKEAYNTEVIFNKLRIQVDALGISYDKQEASIRAATDATAQYAIVQDEEVASVLQQLILQTGKYQQSLENLNLVYDLAYLKGIDAATAATMVGKALSGNIEGLGRLFPELRNVDELLGEFATTAEKAAYAQAFFREKVNNASSQMTQHERDLKTVLKAYDDVKEKIGEFVVFMAADFLNKLKAPFRLMSDFAALIDRMAAKINGNIVLMDASRIKGIPPEATALIEKYGVAHNKTAEEIAAATRAASAKRKADKEAAEQLKKNIEILDQEHIARLQAMEVPEMGSLQAFTLGEFKYDKGALGLQGVEMGEILSAGFTERLQLMKETTLPMVEELTFAMTENMAGAAETMADTWSELGVHIEETLVTAKDLAFATFDTFADGMGDAAAGVIVYGESLAEALGGVLKSVAASVISMLIKMGIQRLLLSVIEKGALVGEASARMGVLTMETYAGAFAATAAIPIVGPEIAPFVAAAATGVMLAGAAGAAVTGTGAGAAIAGIAHGGLDNVPAESTYLLDKGERVLSPRQNRDLEAFIQQNSTMNNEDRRDYRQQNSTMNNGGVVIRELNIMPGASIDAALFDKPIEWWVSLAKKQILPALNVLGQTNATTTLRYNAGRI